MKSMHWAEIGAIIPAAGQGKRMGGPGNKLLLEIAGTPILVYTLQTFSSCPYIREIIIPASTQDLCAIEGIVHSSGIKKKVVVIEGGRQRQDSVYNAIQVLSPEINKVLIHDGARPFLTLSELSLFVERAKDLDSAIMAVPLKDTIKRVNDQDMVVDTPPREELRAVQTPQIFRRDVLEKVHKLAAQERYYTTDDASLLEWQGYKVKILPGSNENIKVTTPEDILVAEAILNKRRRVGKMRVGQGYDVHALTEGRKLIMGGVEIPHDKGLLGHSDADVLTHAIIDALLGGCALGDIGRYFPDTDIQYKGISSLELLERVIKLVRERGYVIGNLDCIIIAQKPKIAPYIEKMRQNLAEVLGTGLESISVKATTTEHLGFEGREEGISAQAVVCLLPF